MRIYSLQNLTILTGFAEMNRLVAHDKSIDKLPYIAPRITFLSSCYSLGADIQAVCESASSGVVECSA